MSKYYVGCLIYITKHDTFRKYSRFAWQWTFCNNSIYLLYFQPTPLRLNESYVHWYSCLINTFVMIVVPTIVLVYTSYRVTTLVNMSVANTGNAMSDDRVKARVKRNQSITRMLIGIIVTFLICHTGKVCLCLETLLCKQIFDVYCLQKGKDGTKLCQ